MATVFQFQPVGQVVDNVLQRVRDPNGTAHSRAFVLKLLTEVQRLINADSRAVLGEADITVDGETPFLDVTGLLGTACIRIETLRDGLRDVTKATSWREIAQADRRFLKRTGGIIDVWAPIGPMRCLLYPAPDHDTVLTAIYTKLTTPFVDETVGVELPDPLVPALVNLTEQILLCRQRLYPSIQPAMDRFPLAAGATSR
jgi:hypothetical protein